MPDLRFRVVAVEPELYSVTPALAFKLHVENVPEGEAIQGILLQCQIRIEPARRSYTPAEQKSLRDLFGEPADWGRTLRGMLWSHSQSNVPSFSGSIRVDLPVPCTFDLTVASAKYFHGLEAGGVPVILLFSGTIFYCNSDGDLQMTRIPWSKEASAEVPVRVWKDMMDHHYPNTAWLCLRRDVFDRLYRHKVAHGLPTWEEALESLLP